MVRPVILARIRANASTAEIEGLRSAVRRARDPEDVAAENQEYEGGHCLDDGRVDGVIVRCAYHDDRDTERGEGAKPAFAIHKLHVLDNQRSTMAFTCEQWSSRVSGFVMKPFAPSA